MDGRKALTPGTKLHFQNRNGGEVSYTITQEIGRGGSCIVYDAFRSLVTFLSVGQLFLLSFSATIALTHLSQSFKLSFKK